MTSFSRSAFGRTEYPTGVRRTPNDSTCHSFRQRTWSMKARSASIWRRSRSRVGPHGSSLKASDGPQPQATTAVHHATQTLLVLRLTHLAESVVTARELGTLCYLSEADNQLRSFSLFQFDSNFDEWLNAGVGTRASSTSRTFCARACGVNGFCRKGVPSTRTP